MLSLASTHSWKAGSWGASVGALFAVAAVIAYSYLAPTRQDLAVSDLRIGASHDLEVDPQTLRVRATGTAPYFHLTFRAGPDEISQLQLDLHYQIEPGDRSWGLSYIPANQPDMRFAGTHRVPGAARTHNQRKRVTWRLPEPAVRMRINLPRWSDVTLVGATVTEPITPRRSEWRRWAAILASGASLWVFAVLGCRFLHRLDRPVLWFCANLGGTLALVLALEGALAWLYCHPPADGAWYRTLRHYYYEHDRRVIQLTRAGAVYDEALTYRLRTGNFEFENLEFATTFEVNSAGLRDDSASLRQPNIIVLGDSQSMGWGVEQEETFAQLLEAQTGQLVLNAAISSYGTVRELRLLRELDTQGMHTLLLQYCDNDYFENSTFMRRRDLPIRSREQYLKQVDAHEEKSSYSPFKLTRSLLPSWFRGAPKASANRVPPHEEVRVFLEALRSHADTVPASARIIVFEISEFSRLDDLFGRELLRNLEGDPLLRNRVEYLPLIDGFQSDHFFRIDDHMRAQGHRYVAQRLLEALTRIHQ